MTWNHLSTDGIAINKDPVYGGIVDFNHEGWFIIPNNDEIDMVESFETKQLAIECLEKELHTWLVEKEKIKNMVVSKLKAEECETLDSNEIARCFKGCVLPNNMIKYAEKLISNGELTVGLLK